MRFSALVAWLGVGFTVACTGHEPASSETRVVGPEIRQAEPGEWASAVAIYHYGALQCTGTLVAPRLVITAGHCINDRDPTNYTVHFGTGGELDFGDHGIAVTKVEASPFYRSDVGGNADAAYLLLEREITDQAIVPIATDPEELAELLALGKEAAIVGFGVRDNKTYESGRKFVGPTVVRWRTGNEVWMGGAAGDGCSGDSGGPAYGRLANGEWRVFGITSRGPSPCGIDAWPGIWGLMHWHACWIQQASGQSITGVTMNCDLSPVPSDVKTRSLADLCRDDHASAAVKHTIYALKVAYAAESATADDTAAQVSCPQLETWAERTRSLDLSRTMLRDLSPLSGFSQLETLSIEDNVVESLEALADLTQLKVLRVGWNTIRDFGAVDERSNPMLRILGRGLQRPGGEFEGQVFESLCTQGQQGLGDPALKASLRALRAYLSYGLDRGCASAAAMLKGMRYMDLSGQNITSLEPLRGAAGVQYLRLRGLTIRDLSPLAAMENLRILDIEGARLGDLAPVAGLVADHGLKIIGTPILGKP